MVNNRHKKETPWMNILIKHENSWMVVLWARLDCFGQLGLISDPHINVQKCTGMDNENSKSVQWITIVLWMTQLFCAMFINVPVTLVFSHPVICEVRKSPNFTGILTCSAGLGGSVGCAVRLETRRSRVQPPPRSATFFRGDWSWNIFYGHSLPSADSRRAVVSFWRKNVHNTG